jgi:chromosome segregation ATPase
MKIEITNGENNPVTDFFSSPSNTPETDAFLRDLNDYSDVELRAMTEHARKLERERDEANEELSKKYIEFDKLFHEAEKIRIERDEARELHRNALREREATEKEVDAMLERAHKAERERDEVRNQLIHLRSCVYDVIHSLKAGAFDELEKAWKEGLK